MSFHHDDAPSPPRCFNREPWASEAAWASQGCMTWAGVGIGPNSEPYPVAMGWKPWCLQCLWVPAEVTA